MDNSALFADIERKYNLPAGYLARTYQIESSSGKNLYNEKSGAAGPFQFMPKTAKAYGLSDPYNLPASADAAGRLAVDNRTYMQGRGVADPNAAQLYLAHQQGAGGAVKLLNSQQPAGQAVGQNAVAWNGGAPSMPGSQFAQGVMDKFAGTQQAQQAGMQPVGAANQQPAFTQPQVNAQMSQAGLGGVTNPAAPSPFNFAGLGSAGMAMMAQGAPHQTWQPGPAAQAHKAGSVDFSGLLSPSAPISPQDELKKRMMQMGLLG